MNTVSFESKLLSDGHLEFVQRENAVFKVIAIF